MIALLLLACTADKLNSLPFDGPVAASFLPPEDGPFDTEVALVANSRSGTVTPLDLKQGRLLTDSATASFLRAPAIPAGRSRLLADIASVGDGELVDIWLVDLAHQQLLLQPWVIGTTDDGAPIVQEPHADEPVFVDADGSGDAPTMTSVKVRSGWTTTEDWSIEYDGTRWWAIGSRSGKQEKEPIPGELYWSDYGEVEFQINGAASVGDRFELHTDTGLREFTFGAPIAAIAASEGRVYVSVDDPATPAVHVYDGLSGVWLGEAILAAGSEPGRIAFGPPGTVYVGDTNRAVVHRLSLSFDTTLTGAEDDELPVAGPVVDLAWKAGDGQDGTPYEHLFVAPLGALRLDVYDTANDAWIDPNPLNAGAWGPTLSGPVSGVAASLGDVWLQQLTQWGARQRVGTIAVTTGDGFLYQVDAETGCLVEDARGPHGPNYSYDGTDYATLQDLGSASDVSLQIDPVSKEQISTSACGGVTRTEYWTVTYDSGTLDWKVEGSLSGVQQHRARLDERYVSDDGAVSFLLLGGALPPTDGDYFSIKTDSGVLELAGSDTNGDGAPDAFWESPGRPLAYETRNGPTGGGWDPVDIRQYALVPATGSDIVGEAWLDAAQTSVLWQ